MARLWSCGLELQTATVGVEFTSGNSSGALTLSSGTVRTGTRSMRANPSAASAWFGQVFKSSASNTQAWARTYLYVSTLPGSETEFKGFWASGAATRQAYCTIDSSGVIRLRDSAGTAKVTSSAISTGTWVRIEFTTNANAGAATMELRIDGASAGTSATGNVGNFDACYYGTPAGAGTYDIYLDDLAINDSSGSAQTSWPGDGSIVHIHPDAAGDNNDWLKQGGGAGSSTNYQDTDEVTPDDATTYVKRTSTGTKIDDYNCESSSAAGIGASDTITLVAIGVRAGATSNTSTNRGGVLRVKGPAGTLSESGTIDWSLNGWFTHRDGTPKNYQHTAYVNPDDSAAWTPSDLDGMQIGFKNAQSSANEIRVTTVWALVEYVPDTGTELTPSPQTIPIATPAPTVSKTYALAPSPQTIPIATPAPAVSRTYALAPSPVTVPIATPAPTITLGAISVTPSPQTVPIATPAPTITRTYALAPSPVTVPIATPAPMIARTYALSPSPQTVPLATPAPTVGLGYALIPAPVAIPIATPAPAISLNLALSPDPVTVPLVLPAPTVEAGITLAPDPVAVPIVTPTPSIGLDYALAPVPVAVPLVLPVPSITQTYALAPPPVAAPLALPAPAIGLALAVAPDPVPVPLVLPAPTITQTGALSLTPDPVVVLLVLPAPTIGVPSPVVPVVVARGGGPTRQTQRLRQPVEQEFERLLRTIWLTPGVLVIDLSTERRAYYDRETEDLIAMGVL